MGCSRSCQCTAVTLAPLLSYLHWSFGFPARLSSGSGTLSRILLIPLYPLMHLANGWGLLCGLFGGKHGRSFPGREAPVSIRRIKEFGQTAWQTHQ